MISDILLAFPLGLLLAFTIGPVFFVLLETAITKGFRATLAFDAGVLLADTVFILIVYFTTNSLLTEIKDDPKLFFAGGIIMMAYGIISFIKLKKDFKKVIDNKEEAHLAISSKVNYVALFIKGFLLNFINIGVLGFWLGIIIVFGPKLDMDASRIFIFFSAIILVYFGVDVIKILIAFHIYKIKRAISIILLVFGVFLIFQAFFPHIVN